MHHVQRRRPRYGEVAHPSELEREHGSESVKFIARVGWYCAVLPGAVTVLSFILMPTVTQGIVTFRDLVSTPLSHAGQGALLFFGPIACGGIALLFGLIEVAAKGAK